MFSFILECVGRPPVDTKKETRTSGGRVDLLRIKLRLSGSSCKTTNYNTVEREQRFQKSYPKERSTKPQTVSRRDSKISMKNQDEMQLCKTGTYNDRIARTVVASSTLKYFLKLL
jgi:hypothetical protein